MECKQILTFKIYLSYSPSGLEMKWLMGQNVPATDRHDEFVNPLQGVSCEDCWDNIWKD